jgi:hypothetical protein
MTTQQDLFPVIFFWSLCAYVALVFIGFFVRGFARAAEEQDMEMHFAWPVLIFIALPIGLGWLAVKGSKEGFRLIGIFFEGWRKDTGKSPSSL